jgi:HEAT repeat protein
MSATSSVAAVRSITTVLGSTQSGVQAARVVTNSADTILLLHPDLPGAYLPHHRTAPHPTVLKQWLHPRYQVQLSADRKLLPIHLIGLDRYLGTKPVTELSSARTISTAVVKLGPMELLNPQFIGDGTFINDDMMIEDHTQYQRQSEILDLVAWLLNGSDGQKRTAIRLIGKMEDLELLPWLMHFFTDEKNGIRLEAIESLPRLPGEPESLVAALKELCKDEKHFIREAAARKLVERGNLDEIAILEDAAPSEKNIAALGESRNIEVVGLLINAFQDKSEPALRMHAAIALGKHMHWGLPEVTRVLVGELESTAPSQMLFRKLVVNILRKHGHTDNLDLLERVEQEMAEAFPAMASVDEDQQRKEFEEMEFRELIAKTRSHDSTHRKLAIEAIAQSGNPKAFTILKNLVSSYTVAFEDLRRYASTALAQLYNA